MDGLDVADLRGADHAVDSQVAVGGPARPDADRLVGKFEVGRTAIGLAVDRNRLDAEISGVFAPGQYEIYVGTNGSQNGDYTLTLTENL